MTQPSLLYLSEADVTRVALSPDVAREAIAAAFAAHHAGRTGVKPKLALEIAPGHSFQSMCAASAQVGVAINKWLGMAPVAAGAGGASIHAMIALNDFATGRLLAVMDGNLLTALRTAAMSAVAARHLAKPSPASIGFVGCGLQAHSHLDAFMALFPGLRRVCAVSRTPRSASRLVERALTRGLDAEALGDPKAVVAESDIVITSVPMHPGFRAFLDPAWLKPGSFVAAVDVGRSWIAARLHELDIRATDDRSQATELSAALGLDDAAPFHADLSALAAGAHPGRRDERQRAIFVFRGYALGDLAVAAVIYAAARKAGIGTLLAR